MFYFKIYVNPHNHLLTGPMLDLKETPVGIRSLQIQKRHISKVKKNKKKR